MRRQEFTRLDFAAFIAFILFTIYSAFDSLRIGAITKDLHLSLSLIGGIAVALLVTAIALGGLRLYYKIIYWLHQ